MRYLLCLVLLLYADTLHSQTLRVTGTGPTYDIAKTLAFREAIQFQVGVVLLSERETQNYQSIRNEIVTYSSGYIDSYKVISHRVVNNNHEVTMEVVVNSSKISNRLLSKSSSVREFDGDRHSTQLETFLGERKDSNKLLQMVTNDYPYRAYNILQKPYNITIDEQRNAYINIPYELTWNQNYINSFIETMRILDDRIGITNNRYPNTVNVGGYNFYFNDSMKVDNLKKLIGETQEIRLHLTVKSIIGQVLAVKCYYPTMLTNNSDKFYTLGYPNKLTINPNTIENNFVALKVNHSPTQLETINMISRLELKIATDKECNK